MYLTTGQVPSVYQWDESSRYPKPDPGSAPSNCGPTCVVFIANFYRDSKYGIYATRRLVVSDPSRGTSANEQRDMLIARGVRAYISQPSVEEMHRIVDSGRRPIIVGLWMAKVPANIRDHDFVGMHAVVLRARTSRNGVNGFIVLDPNFSKKTGRVDPDDGKKFYPDWVIRQAFVDKVGSTRRGWAVVPTAVKPAPPPPPPPPTTPIPSPDLTEAQEMAIEANWEVVAPRWFAVPKNTRLRKGPGTEYPSHYLTTVDEEFYLSALNGGWAKASRGPGKKGFFCVPPPHLRGTGK